MSHANRQVSERKDGFNDETYTEFARCVDELELNLLQVSSAGMNHQTLAESDDTLLGTRDRALEHDKVVLDDAIMGESTHGCDALLGGVCLSGTAQLVGSRCDTVDLLVHLRSVVVSVCRAWLAAGIGQGIQKTYFDQRGQR
jgi:hypothetical protein